MSQQESRRDKQLDQLFRSLPRERTEADFTQKLLLRLAERQHHAREGRRRVWAVAAAAAITAVCATSIVWHWHTSDEKRRMQAEYLAIKDEYNKLSKQYESYHLDLAEFAILRFGGNDSAALVLDLTEVDPIENLPAGERGAARLFPVVDRDRTEGHLDLSPLPTGNFGGSI